MTKAHRAITATSRNRTVVVNHCSGSERFGLPYRKYIRGTQTNASIVIPANSTRRYGTAKPANGTSQSENWGLQTLLVSRKAATTKNASCSRRGRFGAVNAI